MGEWKVRLKRFVYESKIFKIGEQEITFPTGKVTTYDFFQGLPTVTILPITPNNEIYLVSEYRTLHKKRVIEAASGHVHEGEADIETAKRELKEELGISASEWSKLGEFEAAGSVIKWHFSIFIAKGLEIGDSAVEEGEDIIPLKMSIEDAVSKVMTGEINIASSVIGILLLDKLRKENKL